MQTRESLQPLTSSTFASFLWLLCLKAYLRILGAHLALMHRIILGISYSSNNERQLGDTTPSLSVLHTILICAAQRVASRIELQLLTLITFSLAHPLLAPHSQLSFLSFTFYYHLPKEIPAFKSWDVLSRDSKLGQGLFQFLCHWLLFLQNSS